MGQTQQGLTPEQINLRDRMTRNSNRLMNLEEERKTRRRVGIDDEIAVVIREREEIRAAARTLMGI